MSLRSNHIGQQEGDITASAADIQHFLPLAGACPLHCHPFPYPMLPKAQHVVQLQHNVIWALKSQSGKRRQHGEL